MVAQLLDKGDSLGSCMRRRVCIAAFSVGMRWTCCRTSNNHYYLRQDRKRACSA